MTLTPISSRESARKKLVHVNSRYIVSRKYAIKSFWAQEAEMILTPISSLESARKNIFYKL